MSGTKLVAGLVVGAAALWVATGDLTQATDSDELVKSVLTLDEINGTLRSVPLAVPGAVADRL